MQDFWHKKYDSFDSLLARRMEIFLTKPEGLELAEIQGRQLVLLFFLFFIGTLMNVLFPFSE